MRTPKAHQSTARPYFLSNKILAVSALTTDLRRSNYLGCHEFRRATEGSRTGSVPHIFFTESVISNFDMAIESQQYVIKFQITIYNTVLMKILQS